MICWNADLRPLSVGQPACEWACAGWRRWTSAGGRRPPGRTGCSIGCRMAETDAPAAALASPGERLRPRRARRLNGAPFDRDAGGRFEAAVEHVGIEVDLSGPLDRLGVGVDAHLLKELSAFADRGEDAATCKHVGDVDVLDRPVGERDAQQRPSRGSTARLDQVTHFSGSMGSGCLWSRARSQFASSSVRCSCSHSRLLPHCRRSARGSAAAGDRSSTSRSRSRRTH